MGKEEKNRSKKKQEELRRNARKLSPSIINLVEVAVSVNEVAHLDATCACKLLLTVPILLFLRLIHWYWRKHKCVSFFLSSLFKFINFYMKLYNCITVLY